MDKKMQPGKKFFTFRYFMTGVFLALLLHCGESCLKDSYNNYSNPTDVDVSMINDGAKVVQAAFASGDANKIKGTLTADALQKYGSELDKTDPDLFSKLGASLKTRNLDVHSNLYAEYSYTHQGVTFTFALARQKDESWKLMRF